MVSGIVLDLRSKDSWSSGCVLDQDMGEILLMGHRYIVICTCKNLGRSSPFIK